MAENEEQKVDQEAGAVAAAPAADEAAAKKVAKKKVAKKKVAKKVAKKVVAKATEAKPAAQEAAKAEPRAVDAELAGKLREMGLLDDGSVPSPATVKPRATPHHVSRKADPLGSASGLFNLLYVIMAIGLVILAMLMMQGMPSLKIPASLSATAVIGSAQPAPAAPVVQQVPAAQPAAVQPQVAMPMPMPMQPMPAQVQMQPLPPDQAKMFQKTFGQ